ncbi:hypothetical protein ABFA25_01205 [Mycobacterium lepromatosis]|nr:hypothetical protein [Mycobacterium lepromatosis]
MASDMPYRHGGTSGNDNTRTGAVPGVAAFAKTPVWGCTGLAWRMMREGCKLWTEQALGDQAKPDEVVRRMGS